MITDDERIDEAGEESFPASDPPSWTSGIRRVAVDLATHDAGGISAPDFAEMQEAALPAKAI